jgi:hypothetical protein
MEQPRHQNNLLQKFLNGWLLHPTIKKNPVQKATQTTHNLNISTNIQSISIRTQTRVQQKSTYQI